MQFIAWLSLGRISADQDGSETLFGGVPADEVPTDVPSLLSHLWW